MNFQDIVFGALYTKILMDGLKLSDDEEELEESEEDEEEYEEEKTKKKR